MEVSCAHGRDRECDGPITVLVEDSSDDTSLDGSKGFEDLKDVCISPNKGEQWGIPHEQDRSGLCDDSKPGVCKEEVHEKMGIGNHGRFFDISDVMEILLKAESDMMEIPLGHKENEYFVINNERNCERNRAGKRRMYVDDCGAWKSVSIKKHYYTHANGKYMYIDCVGDTFYIASPSGQNSGAVDKSKIFMTRKVYSCLKRNVTYKRRISWIDKYPEGVTPKQFNLALVEYIGKYPTASLPHGNHKAPGAAPYVRTPAGVMKRLKAKVATKTARAVLRDMGGEPMSPRDLKQLENLRYRSNLKIGPGSSHDTTHNEDLLQILSMVHEHPYVQQAICTKHQPPVVIAYTPQQMNALRYHCRHRAGTSRIVGVNCLLTAGLTHLTTIIYTHPNLLCEGTSDLSVMMGPVLLHVDKSWQTYSLFFNHLKGRISLVEYTDIDHVIIACHTSEKSTIIQAINHSFPHASVSLCRDHLRVETEQYLRDEVRLVDHSVKTVSEEIFSELAGCTGQHNFDVKVYQLQSQYDASIPQFSHYFRQLTDNIHSSNWAPALEERHNAELTMDNCETLNEVSKHMGDWEELRLPDLVRRLYIVVQLQEQDEVRALYGEGKYALAKHVKKYALSKENWQDKTNKQRTRLLEGLRKYRASVCKPLVKGELVD